MKISPNYFKDDWIELNLDSVYSEHWIKGADIIYDRIHGRYLAQIEILEEHLDKNIGEFSGFLIMAIDSMVIETLNQFYLGISDTNQKYKRENWKSFRDFFNRSEFFNKDFDNKMSFLFYDHIRNGLVHQAQTKEKSLINLKESLMVKYVDPNSTDKGIIINRSIFHGALVNEFRSYINKLKTDTNKHDSLRQKCINKMETIIKS